jgi:hypothetical protein
MGTTSAEAPGSLYCTVQVLKRQGECWRSKTKYVRNNGTSGSSSTFDFLVSATSRKKVVMKSNWEIINRKVMRYCMVWYGMVWVGSVNESRKVRGR